jgi:hypothetical protein
MYLLHGTFIRIPLAWAYFHLLQRLPFPISRHVFYYQDGTEGAYYMCNSLGCRLEATVIYIVWLGILMQTCRIWKTRVDILGVRFSKWAEDIVMGRRKVEDLSMGLPEGWVRLGGRINVRIETEKSYNGGILG